MVVVARREQREDGCEQPIVIMEPVPPGHRAGRKKNLALVRAFPVSIRCEGEQNAPVFHSGDTLAQTNGRVGQLTLNYV